MGNSVQTNNGNVQEWHNQAFADQYESISARLPSMTFWAIIFSYAATAALNVWAIHLPMFISVPMAIAIQALRFLTVFTPFLNPHGKANHLPEVIAVGASILAMFELSFSIQALGKVGVEFWSIFLFGAAILVLSMILEIQFINQGKKAFGLVGNAPAKQASGGAVSTTQNQASTLPQDMKDHLVFLTDQNRQLLDQLKQQNQNQGNGQAPTRPKQATANMGHNNGYNLNHHNH